MVAEGDMSGFLSKTLTKHVLLALEVSMRTSDLWDKRDIRAPRYSRSYKIIFIGIMAWRHGNRDPLGACPWRPPGARGLHAHLDRTSDHR